MTYSEPELEFTFGKKCDFSLDLKVVRKLLLRTRVGNNYEFQTDGAEYRKERLANYVLTVGLSSSGTSDERRERARRRYAKHLDYMSVLSSLRMSCALSSLLYSV